MHRFIDYFSIRLIIFLASFIAISFIAKKFLMAILSAFVITFFLSIIIDIASRKKTAKNMLYSQFLQQTLIGGNAYVTALVLDILSITDYRSEANYIITEYESKAVIIINAIKFGAVTPDEILRYHQLCQSKDITECYLLSRIMDRRCLAIATNLDSFNMHIITVKYLYRLALKRSGSSQKNLLNACQKQRKIQRMNVADIFRVMLSRRNSSRFLITACILTFMSIFTPLRTYYLIMSAITLLLSALCLLPISEYVSSGKMGIFSKITPQEEHSMRESLNSAISAMSPASFIVSANNVATSPCISEKHLDNLAVSLHKSSVLPATDDSTNLPHPVPASPATDNSSTVTYSEHITIPRNDEYSI